MISHCLGISSDETREISIRAKLQGLSAMLGRVEKMCMGRTAAHAFLLLSLQSFGGTTSCFFEVMQTDFFNFALLPTSSLIWGFQDLRCFLFQLDQKLKGSGAGFGHCSNYSIARLTSYAYQFGIESEQKPQAPVRPPLKSRTKAKAPKWTSWWNHRQNLMGEKILPVRRRGTDFGALNFCRVLVYKSSIFQVRGAGAYVKVTILNSDIDRLCLSMSHFVGAKVPSPVCPPLKK